MSGPEISPEVDAALKSGQPVVALESTIIAHGMPYPQNVSTAREVEAIVRDNGAIPATIAILEGRIAVGMTAEELEHFGREGGNIAKVSTRDLPFVIARKLDGATTVAATMRIAAMAGIHVFATGGIGGAHRGAARSFDISADLFEFTQSNVAVVTAGAKAILDLGLTLETLETLGVPVIGFGTDEFPAFYSRRSGHRLSIRCESAQDVAAVMQAKWQGGLDGGIVVANPIPAEFEIPAGEISPAIENAVDEAEAKGIKGKDLTPFLLGRLAEITEGRSLKSNIALIKNNAAIAAQIAAQFARMTS